MKVLGNFHLIKSLPSPYRHSNTRLRIRDKVVKNAKVCICWRRILYTFIKIRGYIFDTYLLYYTYLDINPASKLPLKVKKYTLKQCSEALPQYYFADFKADLVRWEYFLSYYLLHRVLYSAKVCDARILSFQNTVPIQKYSAKFRSAEWKYQIIFCQLCIEDGRVHFTYLTLRWSCF